MKGQKHKIFFSTSFIFFFASIAFAQESNLDDLEKRLQAAKKAHAEKVENERKVKAKAEAARKAEIDALAHKMEAERIAREEESLRIKLASVGVWGVVEIPGGQFLMGSNADDDYRYDEQPAHFVSIKPFRMMKYEVTFAQWDLCVEFGGCNGYRPDDKGWGRGNRPVMNVSWRDIQSYITWLNKKTGNRFRLPSEAEWEYVARAQSKTNYPWGNRASRHYANFGEDDDSDGFSKGEDRWQFTAPVGNFPANGFGLYDMQGNVSEWVQDCYASYDSTPTDGSALNRRHCEKRVLRGGSWDDDAFELVSSTRSKWEDDHRSERTGFRLAQDL